jgi:hypothetical protein
VSQVVDLARINSVHDGKLDVGGWQGLDFAQFQFVFLTDLFVVVLVPLVQHLFVDVFLMVLFDLAGEVAQVLRVLVQFSMTASLIHVCTLLNILPPSTFRRWRASVIRRWRIQALKFQVDLPFH